MTHTLEAQQRLEFINAFAPRRNRSVRRRCRQIRWDAIQADLEDIRAKVAGKKTIGTF